MLPVWTPEDLCKFARPCKKYDNPKRIRKLLGDKFTALDVLKLKLPEHLSPIIQTLRMLGGNNEYVIGYIMMEVHENLEIQLKGMTEGMMQILGEVEKACSSICDFDELNQYGCGWPTALEIELNRIDVAFCKSVLYDLATNYPELFFDPHAPGAVPKEQRSHE